MYSNLYISFFGGRNGVGGHMNTTYVIFVTRACGDPCVSKFLHFPCEGIQVNVRGRQADGAVIGYRETKSGNKLWSEFPVQCN